MSCGKITGIFGTNSSGKTSLIQYLLMLKQTKDATDRAITLELNGDLVKLGTIKDAVNGHVQEASLEFELDFKLDEKLRLFDPSGKYKSEITSSDSMSIKVENHLTGLTVSTNFLSYRVGDKEFGLERKKSTSKSEYKLFSRSISEEDNEFSLVRTQGRAWQLPGPIKSYAFPDQARTYYQNAGFLADIESSFEAQLDSLYYLGPLREFPQRDYLWARSRPTDVGQRGEKAIEAILAATEAGETQNLMYKGRLLPFQKLIAHWLKAMGLIESFSVEEIAKGSNRWQAKIVSRRGSSEVLLTDVGFGVSQVLPVVTLLLYVPSGSTVILEQPEIHLHPLAQANLADVIIHAAKHRNVQVILESHSEHLLLRLQRRVAEELLTTDDLKLYFCDAPEGVSTIIPLELDLFGTIKNWPENFMGDAFGETAERELASLKRQNKSQ